MLKYLFVQIIFSSTVHIAALIWFNNLIIDKNNYQASFGNVTLWILISVDVDVLTKQVLLNQLYNLYNNSNNDQFFLRPSECAGKIIKFHWNVQSSDGPFCFIFLLYTSFVRLQSTFPSALVFCTISILFLGIQSYCDRENNSL